jgi:hypothetical protein
MTYSLALEQQVDMLRYVQSPGARRFMKDLVNLDDRTDAWIANTVQMLDQGDPYYWSPDLCQVAESITQEIPPWMMEDSAIPSTSGVMWFEQPLTMPEITNDDGDSYGDDINGFGWLRVEHDGLFGVELTFFTTPRPLHVKMLPTHNVTWYFGETQTECANRRQSRQEDFERRLSLVASTFTLVNQRITVTDRTRTERGTRRRLHKIGWDRDPSIRVVKLRRTAYEFDQRDANQKSVEWSCQWVVSGHWRQQPVGPGRTDRRPTFILPYVKGDPTKVLKAPAERVFVVIR